MDEFSDFYDFCSDGLFSDDGGFYFFIPGGVVWSDFVDCIDDYSKGDLDLFES